MFVLQIVRSFLCVLGQFTKNHSIILYNRPARDEAFGLELQSRLSTIDPFCYVKGVAMQ